MVGIIKKWGDDLVLQIPPALAKQLQEDDRVALEVGAGVLTIQPSPQSMKLDDLLAKITSENLHAATDWGSEVRST